MDATAAREEATRSWLSFRTGSATSSSRSRATSVSENSLALVALIFAVSEIDAWSVVVNPRLSAREVDLIREHSGARRAFYTTEVSEAAR